MQWAFRVHAAALMVGLAAPAVAFAQPEPRAMIVGQATERALTIASRDEDPGRRFSDLLFIGGAQVTAGDRDGARSTITQLLALAERGDAADRQFGHVAALQLDAGDFAAAAATAGRARDATARAEALKVLAGKHAEAGRTAEALAMIAQSPAGALRNDASLLAIQRAVNAHRYPVARALATGSQDAMQMAEDAIAQSAAEAGAFDESRAAIARLVDPLARSGALHFLGKMLGDAGRRDEALVALRAARDAARSMPAGTIREITFDLVAEELSRMGAFPEALALVDQVRSAEESGEGADSKLLRTIAGDQAWAGDTDGARATARRIRGEDSHLRAEIEADIVVARIVSGAEPATSAARIRDAVIRRNALAEASTQAARRGNVSLAKALTVSAARAAEEHREDRDNALVGIARQQIEAGFLDEARASIARLRDPALRAGELGGLGAALAKKGAHEAGRRAFADALALGRGRMGADDYAFIVEEMAESGLTDDALKAAENLPAGGFDRDFARASALRTIAIAFARAGDSARAFDTLAKTEPILGVRGYLDLLRALQTTAANN